MIKKIGFLFILLILNSCSIFDDPETEIEKLPPITQTGRWTFGCLVNGQAVRITNSLLMRAEIHPGDVFVIRFDNTVDNKLWADKLRQFTFRMTDPLEIGTEYNLTEIGSYRTQYINYINGSPNCTYEPENTISGRLTFSNIDRIDYILSGTFEFETITPNCDTIKVTDGRFDLHYHPVDITIPSD